MKKDKFNKKVICQVWVGDNDKKQQCPNTFELSTSTTNLASNLRADHRLDKNGPLLPLSGIKEITQLLTVQLDSSQSTLPELFSRRMPLPEKKTKKNYLLNLSLDN